MVDAWKTHSFDWVISPPLLAEIERVLASRQIQRFLRWNTEECGQFLAALGQAGHMVAPAGSLDVVADPADNRVIEAAVQSRADYMVTGDRHLLALGEYEGVQIITPVRFLAIIHGRGL